MRRHVLRHLGLNCLLRPVCPNTYGKYGTRQKHVAKVLLMSAHNIYIFVKKLRKYAKIIIKILLVIKSTMIGPDRLEVVASFCYLGDMFSAAGGCELSTTTRVKTAWKKFKALLPVLSSRQLSFKTRGRVYSSCAERNAPCQWDLAIDKAKPPVSAAKRAMIRQICNVRPQETVSSRSNALLVRLGIEDLDLILKERRLWWYGHVECWRERTCGKLQWCSQDSLWHTGWRKAWAWEAQDDMEAADREGLQRVEALGYQLSW